ncbi:uncharacterized protein LOC132115478 isoform X1 [Carassius carassius]|uniref:uncharacterized protein LOC132115478 isoform X1 n=1 Tax=Carassius carassius TaxID=217509 RepID=UPI00286963B8|nr:uncharacterized protein LOC132115478 isoform X1 [Carassius carassius]
MLFKVQYQGKKKYIKLNGASYPAFLREAKEKFSIPPETNMYVLDDSGTEVDEEVFSDILEEKADILWTIVNVLSVSDSPIQSSCTDTLSLSSPSSDSDASLMSPKRQRIDDAFVMSPKSLHTDDSSSQAKELVKRILEQKPGGEKILAKYAMTGEMKDRARRDLVSIVVAEMFEKYGRAPPMDKRAQYALGIVTLFPSLKDPYSKKGYEHFFDIDSNEGYIAWKIKNTQRELSNGGTNGSRRRSSQTTGSSGPNLEREVTKVQQLEGDQCREAISLLKHSTDNEQIFMKMRETFQHRQKLIHDPEQCSTVLTVFPRFLDTKGLVAQDFDLLFGAETSSKLLEKWDFLKAKVIEQAKDISKTPLLDHLIQSAEENTDEDDEVPGWDSDMASLLLLVYLLPPPPSGKKGAVKISTREAVDHVVKFHKSCRSLQEHSGPNQRRQPYILAVGTTRKHIYEFYIALDGDLLPCKGKSSLSAFDELFKAHYVFGISYDQALNGMYTFVQTTIYNIDVGHSHETPRVKDLRAKLLN